MQDGQGTGLYDQSSCNNREQLQKIAGFNAPPPPPNPEGVFVVYR